MSTTEIDHALRNLRHLYEQMLDGHVLPSAHDIANAARGLLGPAIENVERAQKTLTDLQAEHERATGQEKQTATALDGFVGDLEKAHNAQVPSELHCPKCGLLHVDQDEWATTRLHRKHLCHGCGNIWQPYPVTTVGVDFHVNCRERIKKLEVGWKESAERSDDITKRRDELLKKGAEQLAKSEQLVAEAHIIMDRDEAIIVQLNAENETLQERIAGLEHDLAWTRAQWSEAGAEIEALAKRRDELLELCAKLTRETPYSGELEECKTGRAALIAEVGTLRARITELETQAKGGNVDMRTEYDGTDYG